MSLGKQHTERSPAMYLPVLYMATGVFAFIVSLIALGLNARPVLAGHFGSWAVLGTTHLFTLGFITMVMMGAFYQLVPVTMNTRIRFESVGVLQYGIYTTGTFVLIIGMFLGHVGWIVAGGIMIGVAVLLFLGNIGMSMAQAKQRIMPNYYMMAALGYLILTVTLGLVLALNLRRHFLAGDQGLFVHLFIGLGGWVSTVIMGMSYKLLAMFLPSKPAERHGWWAFGLFQSAILLALAGGWFGKAVVWAALVVAGIAAWLFLWDVYSLWQQQRRRHFDPALVSVLWASLCFALFWPLLAVAVFSGREWPLVFYLFINGWISGSIIGYLQKIIPFLVWLHRYSRIHGKGRVPRLIDILPEKASWQIFSLYVAGMLVAALGLAGSWLDIFRVGIFLELSGALRWGAAIATALKPKPFDEGIETASTGK